MQRDVALSFGVVAVVSHNIQRRQRWNVVLRKDDPDAIRMNWVVNDDMTMRQLIEHLKKVVQSYIELPKRSNLREFTYVKTDLVNFNLVTVLRAKDFDKKIRDLVPRTGGRYEDELVLGMTYEWFVGKENDLNPNIIGCHYCGKTEGKMQKEKSAERRIFCDRDCQSHFYSGVFALDIEESTKHNSHYLKVVNTTQTQQLVVMCITPEDKEIGGEIHPKTTQIVRVESGEGEAIVDGVSINLKDGSLLMINPGAHHNIINISNDKPLKLYSVCSPPHHWPTILHKRKPKKE